VRLLNGSSHVVTTLRYGSVIGEAFGTSLARVSPTSVAVGAPGPLSTVSHVYFHNTALFATTGSGATQLSFQGGANERLGASLASGFDLDGDGFNEIVAGSPGSSTAAGANAGKLRIFYVKTEGTALSWGGLGSYDSNFAGENLGESLDAAHDYDGDGVVDIVAGAPHHLDSSGHEVGRVLVLSGGALLAQTIYTFTSASVNFSEPHFGAAVKASRDLNGDGVGDIVVGEPDYPLLIPTSSIRGHVAVFSGATGKKLVGIIGGTHDQLGGAVTGAITDLDGDGFREIVATGPLSNANGTDSGVLRCYRLFPIAPATYCTGKLNSAGCTPGISFTGTASETSGAPFLVRASDFLNQKIGLLFYGHQPTSVAFQGGFKCVEAPTLRTLVQNSGGSASGADCTGTYSFDFNALAAGSTDPTLVAGAEVFAQYWARDPLSPSTTSLSNALSFVIHP
jgi:hypothetical protein